MTDGPSFEQTSGPRPVSKTEQAAGKRAAFHVFYEAGRGCRTRIYFDPVFPAQADTPEAAARFIQAVLVEVREPRARVVRVHTITDA